MQMILRQNSANTLKTDVYWCRGLELFYSRQILCSIYTDTIRCKKYSANKTSLNDDIYSEMVLIDEPFLSLKKISFFKIVKNCMILEYSKWSF